MSDEVKCPHCGNEIDTDDCDLSRLITTYHGDGEAVEIDCEHCGVAIYLKEYVTRWWTAGRTPQEAQGW